MLLGLAIEYVEAINNEEIPAIVSSFERVAHAEAQKYADELYDSTLHDLHKLFPQAFMPLEEEDII